MTYSAPQTGAAGMAFWLIYLGVIVAYLVACFVLAIIPSKIAGRKGYSKVGFYWFGVGVLPAAIIVACVLKNKNAAAAPQAPQEPPQSKLN